MPEAALIQAVAAPTKDDIQSNAWRSKMSMHVSDACKQLLTYCCAKITAEPRLRTLQEVAAFLLALPALDKTSQAFMKHLVIWHTQVVRM